MSFIEYLSRHGEWTGKNWTASAKNNNHRILTKSEKYILGVDPYDNYVSKAHDLNEAFAQYKIRAELSKIPDLSHLKTDEIVKGEEKERYYHGIEYSYITRIGEIFGVDRCISIEHYSTYTNKDNTELCDAFYNYYNWKFRSNIQFCLDAKHNKIRGLLLSIARFGKALAPINFYKEAKSLKKCMDDLINGKDGFAVSATVAQSSQTWLLENFVSPNYGNKNSDYIYEWPAERFVRTISVEELLTRDPEELLKQVKG